jgi:hypothetical protein
MSVSVDCPFLIAPSVFSNVYLPVSLDCPFLIALSVFSNVYLPVSLDCPFLIASSVFSNVYLHTLMTYHFPRERVTTKYMPDSIDEGSTLIQQTSNVQVFYPML